MVAMVPPLEMTAGDALVVPMVAMPVMIPVVSPPARIHMMVKPWDPVVMGPPVIIIMRAIPVSFIGTPPPAAPEEQLYVNIRGDVYFLGIRYFHQIRRSSDDDRRKTDVYMDTGPCHCRDRS
jgi:hypothetical protein